MEITINNLNFYYDKNIPILNNININFNNNKINAIIGPNGSGKTTLMEIMLGLRKQVSGSVKIDDLTDIEEIRKQIGYVSQFPDEQFFNKTVKEELSFSVINYKYKLDDVDKRINDVLKMVNLPIDTLSKNPFKLSSGEKRKLSIAISLMLNPKVLILDEPTVNLDNNSKNNLMIILNKLKTRYNKTIIIISHDTSFLYKFVDYIYILNKGNLVASGSKFEILNNIKLLNENDIAVPKISEFINYVKISKNKNLGEIDDMLELMKAIYRNV